MQSRANEFQTHSLLCWKKSVFIGPIFVQCSSEHKLCHNLQLEHRGSFVCQYAVTYEGTEHKTAVHEDKKLEEDKQCNADGTN